MTRLYIDRQEVTPLPADLNSIEQVLKLVEANHLPPQAVIRRVEIDGLPLISEDGSACHDERIESRERIEIFTGTITEVAMDSMREAPTYLERVESATPSLINSFRSSPGQEAFDQIKQFYEGFYWLILLLDRLGQSFHFSLDSLPLGDSNASTYHQDLISTLKGLIEAQERKDFGLVADLLEFEMLPLISACRSLFAAVRERILSDM